MNKYLTRFLVMLTLLAAPLLSASAQNAPQTRFVFDNYTGYPVVMAYRDRQGTVKTYTTVDPVDRFDKQLPIGITFYFAVQRKWVGQYRLKGDRDGPVDYFRFDNRALAAAGIQPRDPQTAQQPQQQQPQNTTTAAAEPPAKPSIQQEPVTFKNTDERAAQQANAAGGMGDYLKKAKDQQVANALNGGDLGRVRKFPKPRLPIVFDDFLVGPDKTFQFSPMATDYNGSPAITSDGQVTIVNDTRGTETLWYLDELPTNEDVYMISNVARPDVFLWVPGTVRSGDPVQASEQGLTERGAMWISKQTNSGGILAFQSAANPALFLTAATRNGRQTLIVEERRAPLYQLPADADADQRRYHRNAYDPVQNFGMLSVEYLKQLNTLLPDFIEMAQRFEDNQAAYELEQARLAEEQKEREAQDQARWDSLDAEFEFHDRIGRVAKAWKNEPYTLEMRLGTAPAAYRNGTPRRDEEMNGFWGKSYTTNGVDIARQAQNYNNGGQIIGGISSGETQSLLAILQPKFRAWIDNEKNLKIRVSTLDGSEFIAFRNNKVTTESVSNDSFYIDSMSLAVSAENGVARKFWPTSANKAGGSSVSKDTSFGLNAGVDKEGPNAGFDYNVSISTSRDNSYLDYEISKDTGDAAFGDQSVVRYVYKGCGINRKVPDPAEISKSGCPYNRPKDMINFDEGFATSDSSVIDLKPLSVNNGLVITDTVFAFNPATLGDDFSKHIDIKMQAKVRMAKVSVWKNPDYAERLGESARHVLGFGWAGAQGDAGESLFNVRYLYDEEYRTLTFDYTFRLAVGDLLQMADETSRRRIELLQQERTERAVARSYPLTPWECQRPIPGYPCQ